MALQSSGAIALDDIHDEAGGTSGSTCTVNDADIRGLIDASDGATTSFDDWYGASAFTARWVGAGGGQRKSMQYVDVATLSNASDFGDMHFSNASNESREQCASASSITRGVYLGGNSSEAQNTLEYITFASTGNGTDFGDCGNSYGAAGASNDTRGVFLGNINDRKEIEYITIASVGNTTDFGECTTNRFTSGTCASSTRAVAAGGTTSTEIIEYITTASTGNGTDFGDLTAGRGYLSSGAMGSNTRGLFCGGHRGGLNPDFSNGPVNIIDYITISSTGNAIDFGNIIPNATFSASSGSSKTRALPRCGGYNNTIFPQRETTMDYVTIASTGDASDFGDLVNGEYHWSGASNGCGGTSSG